MVWAKVDDQFTDHEKVVGLSLAAKGLWLCGLVYSARRLTDGFVSESVVAREAYDAQTDGLDWVALANELVNARLWDEVEGGYRIHDYLDYNPSRAEVEADRMTLAEKRAAAGRRGGIASGQARSNQNEANGKQTGSKTEANANQNGSNNEPPYPYPVALTEKSTPPAGAPTREAEAGPDALPPWDRETTPVLALFAGYAAGVGIRNGSAEWLTRQQADLPVLRDAVHAGLDPGKLERMARYVGERWRAWGIAQTPKVAAVVEAESEFDRWEAEGKPAATIRGGRSPTPLRAVPTRDNIISGDGKHVPF